MEVSKFFKNLDILREIIIDEAKQKAAEILNDARNLVQKINSEVEKEERFYQVTHARGFQDEIENELRNIKLSLERERKKKILSFKQEKLEKLLDEIIKTYKNQLATNMDFYYDKILRSQIENALKFTSFKKYYLIVNRKDHDYLMAHPEYLKSFSHEVILRDEILDDGEMGCIVEDEFSRMRLDNRFSKQIEINEDRLKMELSRILFKGA